MWKEHLKLRGPKVITNMLIFKHSLEDISQYTSSQKDTGIVTVTFLKQ